MLFILIFLPSSGESEFLHLTVSQRRALLLQHSPQILQGGDVHGNNDDDFGSDGGNAGVDGNENTWFRFENKNIEEKQFQLKPKISTVHTGCFFTGTPLKS